jgi:CheY-like chemotaxis protein
MSSGRAHNVQVRVLVVEDHVALANRIAEGLRDAGFAVDVVYDGAAALESAAITDYDVVDNAERYNIAGGTVAISTATDDGASLVRVVNTACPAATVTNKMTAHTAEQASFVVHW